MGEINKGDMMPEERKIELQRRKIHCLREILKDAYVILKDNDMITIEFENEILNNIYDYSKVSKEQDSPVLRMLESKESERIKILSERKPLI